MRRSHVLQFIQLRKLFSFFFIFFSSLVSSFRFLFTSYSFHSKNSNYKIYFVLDSNKSYWISFSFTYSSILWFLIPVIMEKLLCYYKIATLRNFYIHFFLHLYFFLSLYFIGSTFVYNQTFIIIILSRKKNDATLSGLVIKYIFHFHFDIKGKQGKKNLEDYHYSPNTPISSDRLIPSILLNTFVMSNLDGKHSMSFVICD